MAKVRLDKNALDTINSAIGQAESKTSGEIALAFTRESYNYALQELRFSVIFGFIYFMILLVFAPGIEEWIRNSVWDYHTSYLLMAYGFSTFIVIVLGYLLTNIPWVDRLIVSRQFMREKVRERAIRHFVEAGVDNTRDRTGVLIFISLLERRVELIADRGVVEKINQEQWKELVDHIVTGIKRGRFLKHVTESIESCGELLSTHFPRKADDRNELKDDMQLLEK